MKLFSTCLPPKHLVKNPCSWLLSWRPYIIWFLHHWPTALLFSFSLLPSWRSLCSFYKLNSFSGSLIILLFSLENFPSALHTWLLKIIQVSHILLFPQWDIHGAMPFSDYLLYLLHYVHLFVILFTCFWSLFSASLLYPHTTQCHLHEGRDDICWFAVVAPYLAQFVEYDNCSHLFLEKWMKGIRSPRERESNFDSLQCPGCL